METDATQAKTHAGEVATTTLARAKDMAIVEATVNFILIKIKLVFETSTGSWIVFHEIKRTNIKRKGVYMEIK